MGVMLWFVPTYQVEITEEVREKIVQEQRKWRGDEIASFVTGFHDLSTSVLLRTGARTTIRGLLFRFLTNDSNCPRKTLFHGADRCQVHEGWIYLKYHRDDAGIFRRRASCSAREINQMIEDGEEQKVFTNVDIGIQFGGEITKTYSITTQKSRSKHPAPMDSSILNHFNAFVRRMQNIAVKHHTATPDNTLRNMNSSSLQQSYTSATRAASTTVTSTTRTSDHGKEN